MPDEWETREERAYTEGIDHAVRQVNEELERIGSHVRFVNAGLATVCIIDVNDPEFRKVRVKKNDIL